MIRVEDVEAMDRAALVAAWADVFGGPAPKGIGQTFLRRFLAFELQTRRSGGLSTKVLATLIKHKEKTWAGQHEAIIEEVLWEEVQARLMAASTRRRGTLSNPPQRSTTGSALLLGKCRDETGDLLTPTHTQRHGKRIRYYVSNRLLTGTEDKRGWRLPARELEQAVAAAVEDHLAKAARHHKILQEGSATETLEVSGKVAALTRRIRSEGVAAAAPLIEAATLDPGRMFIALSAPNLGVELGQIGGNLDPTILTIDATFSCKRRGVELKLVAGDRLPSPDQTLLRGLRAAHRWANLLKAGTSIRAIAVEAGVTESYIRRVIPLSTLSPKIQDAIAAGTHPVDLSLERLVRQRLPLRFSDQERMFGLR
jgi:lambda repressor-like predicted transcriptional regulator